MKINKKLNILVSTGIYPPKIGGPAQYTKNLKEEFEKMGHKVLVQTFDFEDHLPTGIRHLFFFFKIIPAVLKSDVVFIFDTFSVGLPTLLACRIFGKKSVVRIGGDFLWEQYVERTGKKVLLRNFYLQEMGDFSRKDKIIFNLTKWFLKNVTAIIFSTEWQKEIFVPAYGLKKEKIFIVENYYGPKEESRESIDKIFVASARNLKLKNLDLLKKILEKIKKTHRDVQLYTNSIPFNQFMNKMKNSYVVILVSLGDISPGQILDAIRYNKPFICTREVGIYDRIKDVGIFVDPLDEEEIEKAVIDLLDENNYKLAVEKVRNFNFIHTWKEIAEEFMEHTK